MLIWTTWRNPQRVERKFPKSSLTWPGPAIQQEQTASKTWQFSNHSNVIQSWPYYIYLKMQFTHWHLQTHRVFAMWTTNLAVGEELLCFVFPLLCIIKCAAEFVLVDQLGSRFQGNFFPPTQNYRNRSPTHVLGSQPLKFVLHRKFPPWPYEKKAFSQVLRFWGECVLRGKIFVLLHV